MPDFTGVSHIGLSVRDVDRSVAWYTDVLGFQKVMATDAPGIRRELLIHPTSGLMVGVGVHEKGSGSAFDETGTGLDHLSLAVPSRDALVEWESQLTDKGVDHSGIQDMFYGAVLVFRDPDNIQLELFALPGGAP